jgi:hypothetical protein
MAIIELSANCNHTLFNVKEDAFVSVTSAATTDWYSMPDGIQIVEVELAPELGASAKIQATIDTEAVEADTADGVDWPSGSVSERTQDSLNGGSYIRMVVAVGTAKMILRGIRA